MSTLTTSKYNLSIIELVLVTVVSVALGIALWAWTFVYDILSPFLKVVGLKYAVAGLWILPSILLSYIVRKPGVAVLASIMAALVQGTLTHWGLMSLVWGLVQGLGAELVFLLFFYRCWRVWVLSLAAMASSLCSYLLDFYLYGYHSLSTLFNIVQVSVFMTSALIFAAGLGYFLAQRLLKAGLLHQFEISRE